ncbi:hypothetical protein D3C77_569600 [compost metagenome]
MGWQDSDFADRRLVVHGAPAGGVDDGVGLDRAPRLRPSDDAHGVPHLDRRSERIGHVRRELDNGSLAQAQAVDLTVGIDEHPLDLAFHHVLAHQASGGHALMRCRRQMSGWVGRHGLCAEVAQAEYQRSRRGDEMRRHWRSSLAWETTPNL